MDKFPVRNLVALSANPLLLYPTHYVGEAGYISDTETTPTVYNETTSVANDTKKTETAPIKDKLNPLALEHASTQSTAHGEL